MRTLVLSAFFVVALVGPARPGTECITRKSGSVTITTCSHGNGSFSQCRSYYSGSVLKTSCR